MDCLVSDLSEYQAAFLKTYFCPQLFAVVSWGCAATAWLARTLNHHPDIFCVHAANHGWQVLGNCDRLDGLPYMRVLGNMGADHLAAGDVHGVSRHHVHELKQILGKHFNSAVVVREPVGRLRSQLALFAKFQKYRTWDIGYIESIIPRKRVVLPADTYECRFFVHAANMLNAILEEKSVGRIFRSEDLTKWPECLGDFVEEITGGEVSPNMEWLRSAIARPRLNIHRHQPARQPFENWQLDVIQKVVEPESWEIYETLGYPPWQQELESQICA